MSDLPSSFMAMVVEGYVLPEEIDDFVDLWHEADTGQTLDAYLGMTEEEYSLWIHDGSFLDQIISARHHGISLKQAVNDNLQSHTRIAARSNEAWKIKILRNWIESQRSR